ncbi:glycosyltransferase family 2 protein [Sphingopyxis solisilvae]|uniref:glycosyltransferase family 2 protein n=1 Tax=Sphingopyxis solisilvae TaxID=1886788 RepID=UPI001892A516|nr:glycosyltransferase family 2 protein [Sphingopyxis solisilvae]
MTEFKSHVAVLLPCYNEEMSVARTIRSFRAALPDAVIYVGDNNSTDRTVEIALAEGATVLTERMQGKGSVVRRMFADIEADYYVMADGDATYDAAAAPILLEKAIREHLDMVVGCREEQDMGAYRHGHRLGNQLLTYTLSAFFGRSFSDILSGYRVFSRRFVKSFPAFSDGFEIETEISVHALRMRMPTGEVATSYFARPEGSVSKLATYRDGVRILSTIFDLVRQERPLFFFASIALTLAIVSIALAIPLADTYLRTGQVPRFPTAILSSALMIVAFLFALAGLILDTVVRGRRETLRMAYLGVAIAVPKIRAPATFVQTSSFPKTKTRK